MATLTAEDRLFSRPMSDIYFDHVYALLFLYTSLLLVRDCDQPTTMTSLSHAHCPLSLAAAVSACADQQFGTNFHRFCEAQTLGTSLNVGLRAGYLSVHTAGGSSDRR